MRSNNVLVIFPLLFASITSCTLANNSQATQKQKLQQQLTTALKAQNAVAIKEAASNINTFLGDKAGIPEVPDQFMAIPTDALWYSPYEAESNFSSSIDMIEKMRWWQIGMDPTHLNHPLREPASVISGNAAACRANFDGCHRSLEIAEKAAEFLIWSQNQAGVGVFPFPAALNNSKSAPFISAQRFLLRAEKAGRMNHVVKNGWIINDEGDGGLQFDNSECGVALIELYEITKNKKYLDAAKKSADWALKQSLAANWNYNSFSVSLLSKTYKVTGEKKYFDGAKTKALLGVIPGQLVHGNYKGRWGDAHNAKPTYHYIMLCAIAELYLVTPQNDSSRSVLIQSLLSGLKARNKDFLVQGASNKNNAISVLILINRNFKQDEVFLRESLSDKALNNLGKLVSEQARQGGHPLDPREWGLFLEYVAWKGGPSSSR